jgi:hypothetical protein
MPSGGQTTRATPKTSSIAKPTNASFASRCIRVVYDRLRSRSSASSLVNFSRMRVFRHFGAVDVGTYKISGAGRCVRRISVGGIHPGRRRMARSSQSTQIDSPERGHDRSARCSPAKRGRACASPISPAFAEAAKPGTHQRASQSRGGLSARRIVVQGIRPGRW